MRAAACLMRMAMALGRLSRRPWYSSMLLLSRYTLFTSWLSCWSSCAQGPQQSGRMRGAQPSLGPFVGWECSAHAVEIRRSAA